MDERSGWWEDAVTHSAVSEGAGWSLTTRIDTYVSVFSPPSCRAAYVRPSMRCVDSLEWCISAFDPPDFLPLEWHTSYCCAVECPAVKRTLHWGDRETGGVASKVCREIAMSYIDTLGGKS